MTFQAVGLQLLGPVSVALLLFQIYRSFRTSYVLHWTLSFGALAIFHAAAAALLFRDGIAEPVVFISAALIGGAAAFVQLGWLVWGAVELIRKGAVKVVEPLRVLLMLAGVGALSGAIPFFAGRDPAIHRFFFLGLHGLASALTFVACAIAIRRFRAAGFTIASLAWIV